MHLFKFRGGKIQINIVLKFYLEIKIRFLLGRRELYVCAEEKSARKEEWAHTEERALGEKQTLAERVGWHRLQYVHVRMRPRRVAPPTQRAETQHMFVPTMRAPIPPPQITMGEL